MPQNANVRSIEAIDAFRAVLVLYRDRASRILDDVRDDVVRTRSWLQGDCLLRWRKMVHDRSALLAQAEQELFTARLSGHPEAVQERRMAVNRARLAVRQAEEGLDRVRHWLRHYDSEIESRSKPALQLRQLLDTNTQQALTWLRETTDILADYAALAAPLIPGPETPASTAAAPEGPASDTPPAPEAPRA
jgi:hypothetical protein